MRTENLKSLLPCFALSLSACVVPTTSAVLAGKPVTEEQVAFLALKETTKKEVLGRLGSPNVVWEDARVFVYLWELRQGIFFWSLSYDPVDISKRYVLLIQFDEEDRLHRFERTTPPHFKSFGDFLREWVSSPPKAQPARLTDTND